MKVTLRSHHTSSLLLSNELRSTHWPDNIYDTSDLRWIQQHESNYTDLHTSRTVDRSHIIIGTPDFFQIDQGWELLVEVYTLKWGAVFNAPTFTKITLPSSGFCWNNSTECHENLTDGLVACVWLRVEGWKDGRKWSSQRAFFSFDGANNSYKRSMTYSNSVEFKYILLFMYHALYIN